LDFKAGGRNIQRIRKQRKLTQEELAELVGCTANTISRIDDSILAQYIQADSGLRWTHLSDKLSTLPAAKQDKIEVILDCLIDTI